VTIDGGGTLDKSKLEAALRLVEGNELTGVTHGRANLAKDADFQQEHKEKKSNKNLRKRICHNWRRDGSCTYGVDCIFKHDGPPSKSAGQTKLFLKKKELAAIQAKLDEKKVDAKLVNARAQLAQVETAEVKLASGHDFQQTVVEDGTDFGVFLATSFHPQNETVHTEEADVILTITENETHASSLWDKTRQWAYDKAQMASASGSSALGSAKSSVKKFIYWSYGSIAVSHWHGR